MADTETLVADTAPAEAEALVLEPDTAEAEAPEGADTEEPGSDTRELDLLTPEKEQEIRESARKEAIEEARKSFEEESVLQAYRTRAQQSEAWLSSQAANEAQKFAEWVVGEIESGRMSGAQVLAAIKPDNLARGWAGRLATAVQSEQLGTAYALQDANLKKLYPDWRIPQDLARAKEMAIANKDTAGLYGIRDEIWRRAVLENEVPKEAQKVAADNAAKNKKAAGVEKVLEGDKQRAAIERPTAVAGGGGRSSVPITSFNAAAAAYNRGAINGTQYADYAKQFGVPLD